MRHVHSSGLRRLFSSGIYFLPGTVVNPVGPLALFLSAHKKIQTALFEISDFHFADENLFVKRKENTGQRL